MKFEVVIKKTTTTTVVVEAPNVEEATMVGMQIAEDHWHECSKTSTTDSVVAKPSRD